MWSYPGGQAGGVEFPVAALLITERTHHYTASNVCITDLFTGATGTELVKKTISQTASITGLCVYIYSVFMLCVCLRK